MSDSDGCFQRFSRLAGALLCASVLAGCGTLEFFYNRADWLATEYVEGIVSLDEAQSSELSQRFEATLEWHRTEELPRYEALLAAADALVRNDAPASGIEALVLRAEQRRAILGARLAEAVAPTIVSLSAEQIDELAGSLAERAREREAKFAQSDPAARLEARRERMRERVERWTGALSDEQIEIVGVASDAFPDETGNWAGWQRRAGDELVTLLRTGAGVAEVRTHLANWLGGTTSRPAEVVASAAAWRTGIVAFVRTVNAMMTERQRTHVLELMAEYAGVARSAQST